MVIGRRSYVTGPSNLGSKQNKKMADLKGTSHIYGKALYRELPMRKKHSKYLGLSVGYVTGSPYPFKKLEFPKHHR